MYVPIPIVIRNHHGSFDGQVREYKGQVESKELETRKTIYEAVNPQCNHHCHCHLHFDCHEVSENEHSQENIHKGEYLNAIIRRFQLDGVVEGQKWIGIVTFCFLSEAAIIIIGHSFDMIVSFGSLI